MTKAEGTMTKRPARRKPAGQAKPNAASQPAAAAPVETSAKGPAATETHAPSGQDAGATQLNPLAFLSDEQRAGLEKLSVNLARAAVAAQGVIAEAALRQADRPSAPNADPFHVGPALGEVMGRLAGQPDRLMRAQASLFGRYMELWRSTAMRAAGDSHTPVATPTKGDKRFTDPEWSENPMFDAIKQSYLITSDWLNALVSGVDGVDPLAKRRVEFFTRMLTDAFSPSNFLLTNPAALREAMESHGESIARGMEHFAADIERGGGQLAISQTDLDQFKVGENVATAPGKVIFQNEIIQLLQFAPSTETVCETPLLIFPPWINKFYIMDLRAENSMIRWLTAQGLTVFVTSWVNPGRRARFQDLRGLSQRGHLRGHRCGPNQPDRGEDRQHRRVLHRRHPAVVRARAHGRSAGINACRRRPFFAPQTRLFRCRRSADLRQRRMARRTRGPHGRRRRGIGRADDGRYV